MLHPVATRVITSLAPFLSPPLPDPPLSLGTLKVLNRSRRQRRHWRQRFTYKTFVLQHRPPTCRVDARIRIINELYLRLTPPKPPPTFVCADVNLGTRVLKELFSLLPPPEPPPPLVCDRKRAKLHELNKESYPCCTTEARAKHSQGIISCLCRIGPSHLRQQGAVTVAPSP